MGSQHQVDIKLGSSLVTSLTKCGTIMANMGRSTEHLVRHMGEFSLFVPFVGVFIFIIILLVCMCKGKKSKATSDIESKVLAGLQPSVFMKGASCSNCMMVEVGEQAATYGEACAACGRHPRIPYVTYNLPVCRDQRKGGLVSSKP